MEDVNENQLRESIFKARLPLSEVVPYHDGLVTISANPERLKLDFLNEARTRSVDLAKAEDIAGNLQLYFDRHGLHGHIIEDFERKGLTSKLWRAVTPLGKIALPLSDILNFGDVIGSTYPVDKAPAVFLNPQNMVAYAPVPENAYHEVTEAAIMQGVYTTWRHEREHLLRMLEPKSVSEDKKTKILQIATFLTSQHLIFLGSYLLTPEIPSGGDPRIEAYNTIRLFATAGLSLVGSQLITKGLWYFLWNRAERAAGNQGETGKNLPGLFEFQFEKQTQF